LLFIKAGAGDIRLIKDTCVTLNPYVLGRYLLRAPFGSEGWIISINNNWVGIYCLIGGLWHIQTRPFGIIVRGFTWSGEAYLSYSLSAILKPTDIHVANYSSRIIYSWYNNTAYPSEFYGPTGPDGP